MTYRVAKLQPWYHKPKPRCIVSTRAEQQCLFSATYEGVEASKANVKLCGTHAQMADFPVRPIQAARLEIEDR